MAEQECEAQDAGAEDVEDLDLTPEEAEDVKGSTWGSGGYTAPPPPPPPI